MSVFRYKGSKVWTMDFLFHAQRIRESTGTRSKTLALKIEDQEAPGAGRGRGGHQETTATPPVFGCGG
jgi:hypothetical protein